MASIRLVAFDLDNTLVGPDLVLSPRVRVAVARAQAQGVVVTIATGRGSDPTDQFAAQLDLTAPIICFQGGLIYDYRARRILHEERLPSAVIPLVVRLAAEREWKLLFETPGRLYLSKHIVYPPAFMDLLRISPVTWLDDFLTELPELPHKFLVTLNDPAGRPELMVALRAAFAETPSRISFVPSHPHIIEGVPRGVNKATGVAWLAAHLGIAQAETMTVGDNDNDVEMLEWAGLGVAMGGSSAPALAAADETVPSAVEDGAAIALEKFVLKL